MLVDDKITLRTDLRDFVLTGQKEKAYECKPIKAVFVMRTLNSDEESEVLDATSQYAHDIMLRNKLNKIYTLARAIRTWNGTDLGPYRDRVSFLALLQAVILDFLWTCYADLIMLRDVEVGEVITDIKKSWLSHGQSTSGQSLVPDKSSSESQDSESTDQTQSSSSGSQKTETKKKGSDSAN